MIVAHKSDFFLALFVKKCHDMLLNNRFRGTVCSPFGMKYTAYAFGVLSVNRQT